MGKRSRFENFTKRLRKRLQKGYKEPGRRLRGKEEVKKWQWLQIATQSPEKIARSYKEIKRGIQEEIIRTLIQRDYKGFAYEAVTNTLQSRPILKIDSNALSDTEDFRFLVPTFYSFGFQIPRFAWTLDPYSLWFRIGSTIFYSISEFAFPTDRAVIANKEG